MNARRSEIDPTDLPRLLELLLPLDSDGSLAGAIARLERGDIDGGLDYARGAFAYIADNFEEDGQ
jgi:hypothetical protein